MFVVNFDFSDHLIISKLLAVNIPVLITQGLAYPLQRIQTLLMTKPQYYTKNQFQQSQLIFRQMIGIQGFPKLYHGLRYSLDCGMTQMTTKFIMFDYLMSLGQSQGGQIDKSWIWGSCLFATTLGTIASQSAFNFQIIASSLPIDKNNRDQNVRIKLMKYTKSKRVPLIGLKYTVPISILNTTSQLIVFNYLNHQYANSKYGLGFFFEQFFTAQCMLFATIIPFHFMYQRQIEQTLELKQRLPFSKGLLGSFARHNFKGLLLYGCYHIYSQYLVKKQIQQQFVKRRNHDKVMKSRQ